VRAGRAVRLHQGDFAAETVYDDDPVGVARAFALAGAEWIHVVDLDAAPTGEPANLAVIDAIPAAVPWRVQAGGGVRNEGAARALLLAGATRVVIGTAAVERPELVEELAAANPGSVAVGLDARGRDVAVRGWTEGSGRDLHDVAAELADAGVDALIVTQISRDGTLEGPDIEGLSALLDETAIPLIASGGVGTLDHLRMLAAVRNQDRVLSGAIVGRAIYDGKFTVTEALAAVKAV
jgi:phosphoribosylformimino-5-aminoimidazole carboxamide ribotide isomerase